MRGGDRTSINGFLVAFFRALGYARVMFTREEILTISVLWAKPGAPVGFEEAASDAESLFADWYPDPLKAEREWRMPLEVRRIFRNRVIREACPVLSPTAWQSWTVDEILRNEG